MSYIAFQNPVRLGFDPAQEDDTRECFADDTARTLWLLWRQQHIVSQEFHRACLEVARDIRPAHPETAQELEACFGRSRLQRHHDFQCTSLPGFCFWNRMGPSTAR